MTTTMPPVVMGSIDGSNTVLAQALFTGQIALGRVELDTLRNVDEVSTFSMAAAHFALCYPGSRDRYDADRNGADAMSRKILDSVVAMRPSIIRDNPQQSGVGFLAIRNLIQILVEEIPHDKYEETTRVALHALRSAAIFADLMASPVADVTEERVAERPETEQTIKRRMYEIAAKRGLFVEWRQKRALIKLFDDLELQVKTAATFLEGEMLLAKIRQIPQDLLSLSQSLSLKALDGIAVGRRIADLCNLPDSEIAAYYWVWKGLLRSGPGSDLGGAERILVRRILPPEEAAAYRKAGNGGGTATEVKPDVRNEPRLGQNTVGRVLKPSDLLDRFGGEDHLHKYVVVEKTDGTTELRISKSAGHGYMIFDKEKMVGAGGIRFIPDRNEVRIDGSSAGYPTLLSKVEGTELQRFPIAETSGLNRVSEILKELFENKVRIYV